MAAVGEQGRGQVRGHVRDPQPLQEWRVARGQARAGVHVEVQGRLRARGRDTRIQDALDVELQLDVDVLQPGGAVEAGDPPNAAAHRVRLGHRVGSEDGIGQAQAHVREAVGGGEHRLAGGWQVAVVVGVGVGPGVVRRVAGVVNGCCRGVQGLGGGVRHDIARQDRVGESERCAVGGQASGVRVQAYGGVGGLEAPGPDGGGLGGIAVHRLREVQVDLALVGHGQGVADHRPRPVLGGVDLGPLRYRHVVVGLHVGPADQAVQAGGLGVGQQLPSGFGVGIQVGALGQQDVEHVVVRTGRARPVGGPETGDRVARLPRQ